MTMFQWLRPTRIYRPKMYKQRLKGINWDTAEKLPRREGEKVVKGTSKRVVVVKSPDPKFFEEAIFILRENAADRGGGDILREAQRVADDYVRSCAGTKAGFFRRIPALVYAAAGLITAAACGLGIWLIF